MRGGEAQASDKNEAVKSVEECIVMLHRRNQRRQMETSAKFTKVEKRY